MVCPSTLKPGLALLALGALMGATPAIAQQAPTFGTLEELVFDDEPPWVGLAPVDYPLHATLAVGFGSLGGNHRKGIVAGSITNPSVVVTYLDSAWAAIPAATEVLPLSVSYTCYDVAVADFNGDGMDDLAIGRRLGPSWAEPFVPASEGDMIMLNAGPPWVNDLPSGPHFPADATHARRILPDALLELADLERQSSLSLIGNVDASTWVEERRETLDIELGDVDRDGDIDLVITGLDYGIRYFTGDGSGDFVHRRTLVDQDFAQYASLSGVAPNMQLQGYGLHRSACLADLDQDGDLDLVTTRVGDRSEGFCTGSERRRPDRVWFNRSGEPGQPAQHPFLPSPQAELKRPAPQPITWRLVGPASGSPVTSLTAPRTQPTSGTWYDERSTFKVAATDLEGDGDVDLVAASPRNHNAAYLNNGAAGFGSLDAPHPDWPLNDGRPAWVFPSIAEEWTGRSACLQTIIDWHLADWGCAPLPDPADLGAPGAVFEFSVPGVVIDRCSSVVVGDLTGNGLDDVAFSNRADYEDLCVEHGYPYLNDAWDVPPTWDPIWFNTSRGEGCLSFHPVVELAGEANDGTAYAEMIDVDSDGNLDWLDANFSNGANDRINRLFWGLPARLQPPPLEACVDVEWVAQDAVDGAARGPARGPAREPAREPARDPARLRVRVALGADAAELELALFAWVGEQAPVVLGGQAAVRGRHLGAVASRLGLPLPAGAAGETRLDGNGVALVELALPDALPNGAAVWVTGVAHADGSAVQVTNAVRVSDAPKTGAPESVVGPAPGSSGR